MLQVADGVVVFLVKPGNHSFGAYGVAQLFSAL